MALVVDGTVEIKSNADNWTPQSYVRGEGCVVRGAAAPETLTRNAIAAFHRRDFDTAVALYDRALRADPGNAYVLNLKAYSLFKGERLSNAIGTQRESLRVDPEYAWGYFDLARFQCAAGNFDEARKSIQMAREKGGAWLSRKMEGDGEFRRLCRPALR
jgi:tetratricopeptide (TPR) repeat protein